MKTHAFRAMDTDWWLRTDCAADLGEAEAIVRDAEARLSRFRPESALSRLNRERHVDDAAVAAVIRRALEIRDATAGAFDPAVGAALVAAGYTRSFAELGGVVAVEPAGVARVPRIRVDGSEVALAGVGLVDLGGIAKGWTVDRVAEWMELRGARSYVVDGGGDIRVRGVDDLGEGWAVGIGDSAAVRVSAAAVCTSSRRKRRWQTARGPAHHIIDPTTFRPAQGDLEEAVVVAPEAAVADALATAVLACATRGLGAVERLGLAAMVCGSSGMWWMTPRMARHLA